VHAEKTEQRLVLYSPRAGTDTAEKLDALLAERGAEAIQQQAAGR
jgi:hypothetical protein